MSAEFSIKHGNKFAYDLMHKDEDCSTRVGTHWSIIAARGVLSNFKDRRGLRNELDNIDDDIREEMVLELAEIISLTEANREMYTLTNFSGSDEDNV